MNRAKWNFRKSIGWAENQHFLCILYPPVRAQNTENTKKDKKIGAKNVSRETFLLQPQRNDDWANRPTMHDIMIMKRCITIGHTTHRTRSRQFTDPLQDKTSYKADSVTSCYAVAAILQNGTTGQRYAVGGVPYNISSAQNTEGNKALFPLLWFQNPRCLRQNSDLRHTSSGQRSQSGKAALSRWCADYGGMGEG